MSHFRNTRNTCRWSRPALVPSEVHTDSVRLPDPVLVVLVGAAGAGKSTWAAERYRSAEVVSSDELRGIVGSGPNDLDASAEAFALLDQIVAGRLRRRLTTVVDTLGLDPVRRRAQLDLARSAGVPAVVVLLDTPPRLCRERNGRRDRSVPARVLTDQLRRVASTRDEIAGEGWDEVLVLTEDDPGTEPPEATTPQEGQPSAHSGGVVLQVSRFPWGDDPGGWLRDVALAADEAGFAGIALMDHLIQIPQVEQAWSPIPEPFVTLGMLAGLDTDLRLGTLCTPVTFRAPGILAKSFATLDAISGGRAFAGVGAGWFEREHAAYGLDFPPIGERLDLVETAIETMRAIWSPGTREHAGLRVALPETTGYPRPTGRIPIFVGGRGERRTLRIAATLGDGCNLPTDDLLERRIGVLRRHCEDAGRDPADVEVTVLDLPVVGTDRDDVWSAVERHRGRTAAAAFARRHHAGTVDDHVRRHDALRQAGVGTIFVSPLGLAGPDDVLALARLTGQAS